MFAYYSYIGIWGEGRGGAAMAAVDAMVPLTLLPLYLYKAPLTLIPYGCSGAMQGNVCSGCHGAPHSYTDGEQNRSLLHTTCAYGKQSKDLFYTCGKPRFFCKIFDLGSHKPCKSNMVTGPALLQGGVGAKCKNREEDRAKLDTLARLLPKLFRVRWG